MPRWLMSILALFGLQQKPPLDDRLSDLDRRSRKAVGRVALTLNDDDLRRLAALDLVVSIHRRDTGKTKAQEGRR